MLIFGLSAMEEENPASTVIPKPIKKPQGKTLEIFFSDIAVLTKNEELQYVDLTIHGKPEAPVAFAGSSFKSPKLYKAKTIEIMGQSFKWNQTRWDFIAKARKLDNVSSIVMTYDNFVYTEKYDLDQTHKSLLHNQ